ncbi:hypothetical protein F5Y19DRAFT_474635 [Xylariaceae sp. FL1651]|nr:hypothetical protein F5Y19DRAFT_474635 [Xylariaceae sp. FL1651]
MQPHEYIRAVTATLSLFATFALADLAPWQVTGLNTFSPSGRPGSSPNYYIRVNISNPDPTQSAPAPSNGTQGTVNCNALWLYGDLPYNKIYDCQILDLTTPTSWAWTFEPLEANDTYPSPTENFDIRWRAADSAASTEEGVRIWTGYGQFEVGKNMQGTCAASGFCSWGLKAENRPFPINVTSVVCQATVEEALHGINCDLGVD